MAATVTVAAGAGGWRVGGWAPPLGPPAHPAHPSTLTLCPGAHPPPSHPAARTTKTRPPTPPQPPPRLPKAHVSMSRRQGPNCWSTTSWEGACANGPSSTPGGGGGGGAPRGRQVSGRWGSGRRAIGDGRSSMGRGDICDAVDKLSFTPQATSSNSQLAARRRSTFFPQVKSQVPNSPMLACSGLFWAASAELRTQSRRRDR